MKHVSFILFFLIASTSFGQENFDYRTFTKQMCSQEFQGRGYVNGGDSIAAEYIKNSFL